MRAGVVGGGINGVMAAWQLALSGCEVTLFERGELMSATSAASTKLLHGGIRYLETAHFRLVREALHERAWWIGQAPHLAHPLALLLPVYAGARRSRFKLRLGLSLYDLLAGAARLGRSRWLDRDAVRARLPGLRTEGLQGAFEFHDGQMDDHALGLWAAGRAAEAGVAFRRHTAVRRVDVAGRITLADGSTHAFDRVLNVAGPWAEQLLRDSGVRSAYRIDPVRGSHLLIDRPLAQGVIVEMPGTERVCFVLPYQGRTLVGTTEERQDLDSPVACSAEEYAALKRVHDTYFDPPLSGSDTIQTFAGLRPLLASNEDPTRASREAALDRQGVLISVFGGKWTTARVLGMRAAELAMR